MPKRRLFPAFFSMTLFFVIASGSCSLGSDDCEYGDDYCSADGVAHECGSLATTLARKGWRLTRCRDAKHCRVDQSGAYCTLTESPDERCAPLDIYPEIYGAFCDGNTSVSCRSGFPTRRTLCASCPIEDDCDSPKGRKCDKANACEEDFVCDSRSPWGDGTCAAPCNCEEGKECPSCNFVGGDAEHAWICVEKRCTRKAY